MKVTFSDGSSSPPTPPSPLPISFGPGNRRYSFSASSTPSPPFSLPSSVHSSADNLPLKASVFSLDYQHPQVLESKSTCFKDFSGWNGFYEDVAAALKGFVESS
ncbi:hypothetical protein PIB30_061683 [Stylosanthes scabra]|uniref:Uncharacterized protein n=1 Tax=Stylosanthes scabra TaxID=79078 RepID=A0ABU6XKP9_9FABA|nr:hypothetical protein [Stylosanthes scabra]